MPVILHHLDQSRSQRVLWLLEELGIPYELVQHKRQPDLRAPKSLRDVHPLGKAPVIEDDGKVIAESGAIVEYLIKKYGDGKFVPANADRQLDDIHWSHFAEGSLAKSKLNYVADHIKKHPGWFAGGDAAGNPTAADFQMLFPLEAATSGRVPDLAPELKAWVDNAHARPAYQRALEKGGPYSYANP
ncbi:hypothetical protein OC835_003956 [Tilletia horrida]|nr:hypothetical protein OC835_003956 [Tilletia horrida]